MSNLRPGCEWHKDDEPIDDSSTPGCPNCSRLLATKTCDTCHQEFLDWNYKSPDDVIARPSVNCHGDLVCNFCAVAADEAENAMIEEEGGWMPGPWDL